MRRGFIKVQAQVRMKQQQKRYLQVSVYKTATIPTGLSVTCAILPHLHNGLKNQSVYLIQTEEIIADKALWNVWWHFSLAETGFSLA